MHVPNDDEVIADLRQRIKTALECPNGMCGHCIEVLAEEVPANQKAEAFDADEA